MSTQTRGLNRRGRGAVAFTLVELLVVIGIIAILIAILLPVLNRVKEKGNQVKCLSNLRQLGTATMMYLQDSKGHVPDIFKWVPPPGGIGPEGVLMKYHGSSKSNSTVLYMCPSDDPKSHRTPYPFSYTANWHIFFYQDGTSIRNISQVHNSSQKIMIIDESSETVDDPIWAPEHWANDLQNMLSNRHDKHRENARSINQSLKEGNGNVVFADCHAEFLPRKLALDPAYSDPKIR